MAEEQYLTVEQLAKHYQVSVSTVRSWIRTGVLPDTAYINVGRTFRFKLSDVDAALRAQRAAKQEKMAALTAPNDNPDQDM